MRDFPAEDSLSEALGIPNESRWMQRGDETASSGTLPANLSSVNGSRQFVETGRGQAPGLEYRKTRQFTG